MNVESFKELYDSFGVWAPVIIVSITLIRILLNPQKLREFMDTFSYARRRRIKNKEEALASNYLDPLTRQIIQHKLSEDHFHQAVGLRVDYHLRHVLLALCEYSQGEITLYVIKKSILNLSYKNNKLEVSVSKFERIFGRASFLLFILSIVFAAIISLYVIFFLIGTRFEEALIKNETIFFTAIFYIVLMIASSFISLNTYVELKNSERIEKYLTENPNFNNEHLVRYPFSALAVEQGSTGNQSS